MERFAELAKEYGLGIVVGVVLKSGGSTTNSLVAFDNHGREQVRCAKIHPFSFAGEGRLFQSEDRLARMRLGQFTLGYSICHYLRFLELYTALARDCDALVNIVYWTQCRAHQWRTLLQASAIENQIYLVGVNRVGGDGNGLAHEASSMVVNTNGEIVTSVLGNKGFDIIEINKADPTNFRSGFSIWSDRKPDFYRTPI